MGSPALVIGLGNPGDKYAGTRHNAGFMVLDRLANRWGASWQSERKFEALTARALFANRTVHLAKPQTYMNLSGRSAGALTRFYRVEPDAVLVAVDDADLPTGAIRLRPSGSSGGHHGIESVEAHLGTRAFARQKVGIGRARQEQRQIAGYVLAPFAPDEARLLDRVLDRAASQIESWLMSGCETAMNQFNGVVDSPDEKRKS